MSHLRCGLVKRVWCSRLWVRRPQPSRSSRLPGSSVRGRHTPMTSGSRLAALLAYYFLFESSWPLRLRAVLRTLADNNPAFDRRSCTPSGARAIPAAILDSYASLPDGGVAFWIALIGLLLAGTGGLCSRCTRWSIQVFCVPYRFGTDSALGICA